MVSPARRIALQILTEWEERTELLLKDLLRRHFSPFPGSDLRDRSLVMELVKGTLRWRGRIDYLLEKLLTRPLASVPVRIQNALRLGAYQILFLDRIPDRAAVNESVELARTCGHEGHVRFVNGVLRNLIRRKDRIPFPDPSDGVACLAVIYSYPEWLVRRWVDRFGKSRAESFLQSFNLSPKLFLRVNTWSIEVEECMEAIARTGREIRRDPWIPEALEVVGGGEVTALPGFAEGWFYVQDTGSMLVSHLVGARPGERILDACAAPGGKSSHLAQMMGDRGEIVALDENPARIGRLQKNIDRLHLSIVRPRLGDAAAVTFPDFFDRVLIDAPCSGLGTLRRHPEAKWRKREEDLVRHQERQLAILRNIARLVRPGGVLVYSTCSLEPEEDENVIETFLREAPEFVLDRKPAFLPEGIQALFDENGFFHAFPSSHGSDGLFAARLIRSFPAG